MVFFLLKKALWPFKIAWIVLSTLFDLGRNPEIVDVAGKNLGQQKMRRNLTLLGVVIGIAAIVTLLSLGQSLNVSIEQQFKALGLDNVFVEPGSGMGIETAFLRIPEKDIRIIEGIPNVVQVVPFFETTGSVVSGNETSSLFLLGVEAKHQSYLEETGYIDLKEGRLLSDNDVYSIILYENAMKTLFSQELKVRETLEINGKKFRIVGVSQQSDVAFGGFGFFNIGITSKKALQNFGETDPTELAVRVSSKEDVPLVVKRIEARLERAHGEKNFSVLSSENIMDLVLGIIGVVQFFVIAIAAIALVVGGIGIMNTMFMAVTERTKEIGTMKAIGATNSIIRSLFLAEAGIVGIMGGFIGMVLGLFLTLVATIVATSSGFSLPFVLDPAIILGSLFFSFLLGMVSGIAPAEQAIALDPVVAIRYE